MPIYISSIGSFRKKSPEAELNGLYIGRAETLMKNSGYGQIEDRNFPESKQQQTHIRKEEEANRILKVHPKQGRLIVLDEYGKHFTSRQFADQLTNMLDENYIPHFAIGGPDGHGDPILEHASLKICLGKMTWPHRLARVLLSEQIYRALCLHIGHPYHRD